MNDTVLVAYATRYGSTREVAEAAAATLREHGLTVEVAAAKDAAVGDGHDGGAREHGHVGHVGYDGVLLATPFYMGAMLKGAARFLERERAALARLPVALLTCGPLSADDDLDAARQQLDGALAKLGWLHPVAAEMFVGKYDPGRLRVADRLIAALPASPLHGIAAHDDRDWAAIRAWAAMLPGLLRGTGATAD
ncbi:MAG: flavodoxin [Thermoleophilia bacterium]|nr:flavodoxin [Thermoleophilia bacterium]